MSLTTPGRLGATSLFGMAIRSSPSRAAVERLRGE